MRVFICYLIYSIICIQKIIILSFSANAVEAMVSKDIVHRDLKPQNILMNHEGRSLKNPQPQDIKLKIGNIRNY